MSLEDSFNKAAQGLATEAAPQGQAAPAPTATETTTPAGQAPSVPAAPAAPEAKAEDKAPKEWDGKPDTLVGELKQDPKAIQRAYTRKAMALAEAEKKLQEYNGLDKAEIDAYRQWKQQQVQQRQQEVVNSAPAPTQLTPEQYEIIKNDPVAFNAYVQNQINAGINQAAQVLVPQLNALQQENATKHWEGVISDFGEVHPDMWEMHEAGLFKPILEAVVKQGGTLDDAYAQASKTWTSIKAKAELEAQAGVRAKREASSMAGTNSGSDDVVYADSKADAFSKAFDLAVSKKEGLPKDAIISPRGRVKVRTK